MMSPPVLTRRARSQLPEITLDLYQAGGARGIYLTSLTHSPLHSIGLLKYLRTCNLPSLKSQSPFPLSCHFSKKCIGLCLRRSRSPSSNHLSEFLILELPSGVQGAPANMLVYFTLVHLSSVSLIYSPKLGAGREARRVEGR